jgi:hypothetical protein
LGIHSIFGVLTAIELCDAGFHVVQKLLAPRQQAQRLAHNFRRVVIAAAVHDTLDKGF